MMPLSGTRAQDHGCQVAISGNALDNSRSGTGIRAHREPVRSRNNS
ncbi:MAG: hypothetical protein Q6373_018740 [Candidatus Sigynarchaeota archaeon]